MQHMMIVLCKAIAVCDAVDGGPDPVVIPEVPCKQTAQKLQKQMQDMTTRSKPDLLVIPGGDLLQEVRDALPLRAAEPA